MHLEDPIYGIFPCDSEKQYNIGVKKCLVSILTAPVASDYSNLHIYILNHENTKIVGQHNINVPGVKIEVRYCAVSLVHLYFTFYT